MMKRLLLLISVVASLGCGAVVYQADQKIISDAELRIVSKYRGTALARVFLVAGGQTRRLVTLFSPNAVVRIPGSTSEMYLVVQVQGEKFWVSEELFFVIAGDCLELTVGVKPIFSNVRPCR